MSKFTDNFLLAMTGGGLTGGLTYMQNEVIMNPDIYTRSDTMDSLALVGMALSTAVMLKGLIGMSLHSPEGQKPPEPRPETSRENVVVHFPGRDI